MSFYPSWPIIAAAAVLLVANLGLIRLDRRARHGHGARTPAIRHPVVRVGLCLTLVAVGVRPVLGSSPPQQSVSSGADVLIMIDRTTSMGAEDYDGSKPRVTGAALDVAELVQDLAGSRFSVIAIDNDARVEVPFTTDGAAVAGYASAIGWRESDRGTGTDISVGVDLAADVLHQSQSERPDAQRLFVYLGDGEQTIDTTPGSFEPLRNHLTDALVLGYGTSDGAQMHVNPGSTSWVTYEGRPAVSRIDTTNLLTIADQTGGQFVHRTGPGPLPGTTVETGSSVQQVLGDGPTELYWVFGLAAGLLLCVELWSAVGQYRMTRRELP